MSANFKGRELSYEDMRNMTEAEIIAHSRGQIAARNRAAGDKSRLSSLDFNESENHAIKQVTDTWGEAFLIYIQGKLFSVCGDVGAARHHAREHAAKHGRMNVSIKRIKV